MIRGHAQEPAFGTALMLAETECQARLEGGQPMAVVDAYIDALPLEEPQRDGLHLFAWAYGERPPPR
jgi:hypothetical protein